MSICDLLTAFVSMDILNVEADDSPDESRDRRRLNYYHSPTADSEATHSENVAEFPAADEADPSPASLSQVSPVPFSLSETEDYKKTSSHCF